VCHVNSKLVAVDGYSAPRASQALRTPSP
jgi:hypothetical protein